MLVDLHLIFVFSTIALVLFADEQAFLWLRGKKKILDSRLVARTHYGVAAGLAALILTGGLLYSRAPRAFSTSPLFIVKMAAISALIINTYFMSRLSSVAISQPYVLVDKPQKVALFVVGSISVLGWVTAALCGYLLS